MEKQDSISQKLESKDTLMKYADNYIIQRKKSKGDLSYIEQKPRYVIYARKSTEDPDRQEYSKEHQIKKCKEFAIRNNLEIVEIIQEDKSAKKSGKREKFSKMLEVIKSGKSYNSILAWHPDRLARNMKEAGIIMDMLDSGVIQDLKFDSFTFTNDASGKLLLSITFAMAKEFSDKLSVDTKRGIDGNVEKGFYVGAKKRGYIGVEKSYYRRSPSYEKYKTAWTDYLAGKTQTQIMSDLRKSGERINKNSISLFFKDPFYAGVYCVSDRKVFLPDVDPEFEPMVTPEEFLLIQKVSSIKQSGWKKEGVFRPYSQFVRCGDCNSVMTSGVSGGRIDRYLSVTCGNNKCIENRKALGIKPVRNTIRGYTILEFVVEFLQTLLKIDRKTYNNTRDEYIKDKNKNVDAIREQLRTLRTQKSNYTNDIKGLSDRIKVEKNIAVSDRLAQEMSESIANESEAETNINKLDEQLKKLEFEISSEFPSYNTFVNLFKNILQTIQLTDDTYLIDRLTKLVIVNIVAKDKKVSQVNVREPFELYKKMKFTNGVADGT